MLVQFSMGPQKCAGTCSPQGGLQGCRGLSAGRALGACVLGSRTAPPGRGLTISSGYVSEDEFAWPNSQQALSLGLERQV